MRSQWIVIVLGFTLVVAATAAAPAASEPQAAAGKLGFRVTDAISIRAYPRIAAFGQPVIVSGELTPARAKRVTSPSRARSAAYRERSSAAIWVDQHQCGWRLGGGALLEHEDGASRGVRPTGKPRVDGARTRASLPHTTAR